MQKFDNLLEIHKKFVVFRASMLTFMLGLLILKTQSFLNLHIIQKADWITASNKALDLMPTLMVSAIDINEIISWVGRILTPHHLSIDLHTTCTAVHSMNTKSYLMPTLIGHLMEWITIPIWSRLVRFGSRSQAILQNRIFNFLGTSSWCSILTLRSFTQNKRDGLGVKAHSYWKQLLEAH